MKVLAIETSCDETAAAVVEQNNGRFIIHSNVIASQIKIHQEFGGVVPEIASRQHIENIAPVVRCAMEEANASFSDLNAVAVTYAPGLIGALLVGVNYAKALAFTLGVPLIPVHHIEGHICANYIENVVEPPFVCLVASGGHSNIVLVRDYDLFEVIAKTRDDAAGEAFDKIARVLGLGYPGGPLIEKCATNGDVKAYNFPRVYMPNTEDFSFSGVKTAVINTIHKAKQAGEEINKADIAASFQQAVCDVLTERTIKVAQKCGVDKIAIAGGVAANSLIRKMFSEKCGLHKFEIYSPSLKFCTDNAAMIGVRAFYSFLKEEFAQTNLNSYATREIGISGEIM